MVIVVREGRTRSRERCSLELRDRIKESKIDTRQMWLHCAGQFSTILLQGDG